MLARARRLRRRRAARATVARERARACARRARSKIVRLDSQTALRARRRDDGRRASCGRVAGDGRRSSSASRVRRRAASLAGRLVTLAAPQRPDRPRGALLTATRRHATRGRRRCSHRTACSACRAHLARRCSPPLALAAPPRRPPRSRRRRRQRARSTTTGPTGRYLLGGHVALPPRPRPAGGLRRASQRADRRRRLDAGRPSPTPGTPPTTATRRSRARVGWYRKDFRLPERRARLAWVVRFESVNYRARV